VQVEQVNEIMREPFYMYNGKSPAPIALPFPLQLIYWRLMLTPLAQILGLIFTAMYLMRRRSA
jgi:hypothetical protein